MKKKPGQHRRLVLVLMLIVLSMFAFCYALVPLYTVFCQQWGINGKTAGALAASKTQDLSRALSVEFLANSSGTLQWDFHPMQFKIRLHPGEMTRVAYYAKNLSSHTMTVQAIPSVAPGLAAKYLKKTECFCFSQQTLKPGESMKMPILFHIDEDLPKEIKTVTLSYTLFDVTGKDVNSGQTGQIR